MFFTSDQDMKRPYIKGSSLRVEHERVHLHTSIANVNSSGRGDPYMNFYHVS